MKKKTPFRMLGELVEAMQDFHRFEQLRIKRMFEVGRYKYTDKLHSLDLPFPFLN